MTKYWSSPSTPVRVRSPHSMMIAASNAPSTRGAMTMSATPGNSCRGGGAASALTTTACFPSSRSAKAIASWDPMESPSGRACDESTNRSRERIAWTMCWRSGLVVVIGGRRRGVELVDQLFDAVLTGDRFIVNELQFRHAFQSQAGADLTSQKRQRTMQRAIGLAPPLFVAEDGVEHARLLKVAGQLDPGNGDEPQAGIVHFAREQVAKLAADLIGDAFGSRALRHLWFRRWAL